MATYPRVTWNLPDPKTVGEGEDQKQEIDISVIMCALLSDIREQLDVMAKQMQTNTAATNEMISVVSIQLQVLSGVVDRAFPRKPWWRFW